MSRFRPQSLQNLAVLLLFPSNLKHGLNFHHLCFVFGITLYFILSFLFFLKPVFRQRLEQSFFSTVRVCQSFNAINHLALTERLKGSVTITLERTAPCPPLQSRGQLRANGPGPWADLSIGEGFRSGFFGLEATGSPAKSLRTELSWFS